MIILETIYLTLERTADDEFICPLYEIFDG